MPPLERQEYENLIQGQDPNYQARIEEAAGYTQAREAGISMPGSIAPGDIVSLNKALTELTKTLNAVDRAWSHQAEYSRDAVESTHAQNSALKEQVKIHEAQLKYRDKVKNYDAEQLKNELQKRNLYQDHAATFDKLVQARGELGQLTSRERTTIGAAQITLADTELEEDRPGEMHLGTRWGSRLGRTRLGQSISKNVGEITSVGDLTSPANIAMLIRRNPVVATAFAALETMNVAQNFESTGISGVPLLGRVLGQIPGATPLTAYGATIRSGQTTGEGYGAGLAAAYEGFRLGANPFDTVSNEVARSIVTAVRGQGFRGALGREFENSIKGIYQDLGLPVEQIAQLGEIYARHGRLDEFQASMENLDKIAKDSGQSIQNVAEQIQTVTAALVGQGGLRNIGLPQAIVGAVSTLPNLTQQQRQQVTGFFTQGAARYTGFTATAAQTSIGQRAFRQQLSTMLPGLRRTLQAMPAEEQDLMLAQWIDAGILPGITDVASARQLILHGEGMIRGIEHRVGRGAVSGAFGAAHEAANRAQRRTRDQYVAGDLPSSVDMQNLGDYATARGRRAYVSTLEQRLRDTRMSGRQIRNIIDPLQSALAGHRDWGRTLSHAGELSRRYADATTRKEPDNLIGLTPEARKFFDIKKSRQRNKLQGAYEGTERMVGTAFSNLGL